jgi:hypothetical protein
LCLEEATDYQGPRASESPSVGLHLTGRSTHLAADRSFALVEEVRTATRLLEHGFRNLQQIHGSNDFYHAPLLALASGFERLMKSIICLHVMASTGAFPTGKGYFTAGRKGHDLEKLLTWVLQDCFTASYLSRPAAREDHDYLKKDPEFRKLFGILSRFGQAARYHYLDVILGEVPATSSPEDEWQRLEIDFLSRKGSPVQQFGNMAPVMEVHDRVSREVVGRLERCARALVRLFTLGDLGQLAKQQTGTIRSFLFLTDEDLGRRKY